MKSSLILSLVFHIAAGLAVEQACRCRPHQSCWPSQSTWNSFNTSVDGTLVSVKPVASVCHDPSFDNAACELAKNESQASTWRISHPGAVLWTNWEAWAERNESCYFGTSRNIPCGQGRVSLYSAVVEKPEHVQAAVRFASKHNLRLAIKNTGHCFLGRSTAPESLQISTYKMNSMEFVDDFYLTGGSKSLHNTSLGSAVTLGAGVHLQDIYARAAKKGKLVIIGLSHTVGAAGGFIQGGGHSPLGPWKGAPTDHVLEFKLVTADGTLLTANMLQNQDIFWALRGGGGGTFGVVVSVTIQTFPDVPGYFSEFSIPISQNQSQSYWEIVSKFHAALPGLSDAGGSGYYSVIPKTDVDGIQVSLMSSQLFFANVTSESGIRRSMDPFFAEVRKILPAANYSLFYIDHISVAITQALSTQNYDDAGGNIILGSRLISRDFLTKGDGPHRVANALRDIAHQNDSTGFTGHIVAGGAVARNKHINSALNPAWRKTLTHISFGRDWNDNATFAQQMQIRDSLLNKQLPILQALEPKMGAYLNEASAYEKNFQQSFWGNHYPRLYKIKQHVDPNNLFIVRRGVGSEDWDNEGLCRLK